MLDKEKSVSSAESLCAGRSAPQDRHAIRPFIIKRRMPTQGNATPVWGKQVIAFASRHAGIAVQGSLGAAHLILITPLSFVVAREESDTLTDQLKLGRSIGANPTGNRINNVRSPNHIRLPLFCYPMLTPRSQISNVRPG